MRYYIRLGGREDGPFEIDELKRLRSQSRFSKIHEISTDRIRWQKAAVLTEVFAPPPTRTLAVSARPSAPGAAPNQPPVEFQVLNDHPDEEWYFTQGGQNHGPYQLAALKQLFQTGQLLPDTKVWTAARGTWSPAVDVPEIANALPRLRIRFLATAPRWVKWTATALTLGVVILCISWAISKYSGDPRLVSQWDDADSIREAVGFVIRGYQLSKDGQVIDQPTSLGTCFAVSPQGLALTNNHVVTFPPTAIAKMEEARQNGYTVAEKIWVFFGHKQLHQAELVSTTREPDLAILKLDHPPNKYFKLSATRSVAAGRRIYAWGFPAVAQSAPEGSMEADYRALLKKAPAISDNYPESDFIAQPTDGIVGKCYPQLPQQRFWQIDHSASISQGNSGGPLIDANGTVVGLNTMVHLQEGAFRIIPISLSIGSLRDYIQPKVPGSVWAD